MREFICQRRLCATAGLVLPFFAREPLAVSYGPRYIYVRDAVAAVSTRLCVRYWCRECRGLIGCADESLFLNFFFVLEKYFLRY